MSDPFLDAFKRLPLLDKPQYVRDAQARQKEERQKERAAQQAQEEFVITSGFDDMAADVFESFAKTPRLKTPLQLSTMKTLLATFQRRGFAKGETLALHQQILQIEDESTRMATVIGLLGKETLSLRIQGLIAVVALEDPDNIRNALYLASVVGGEEINRGVIQLFDLMTDEVKEKAFPDARPFEANDFRRLDKLLLSFVPDEEQKSEMLHFLLDQKLSHRDAFYLFQKRVLSSFEILSDRKAQQILLEKGLNSEYQDVRRYVVKELIPQLKSGYDQQQLMISAIRTTFNLNEFHLFVDRAASLFQSDREKERLVIAILSNGIVKNTRSQADNDTYKQSVLAFLRVVFRDVFASISDQNVQQTILDWTQSHHYPAITEMMTPMMDK